MKKISRKQLKAKCDKAFSEKVRAIGRCAHCGKTSTLACAHILNRKNLALRWDPINALCLCYRCHIHFAHKEPLLFIQWFADKYPERYEYLIKHQNDVVTFMNYEEMYNILKSER